ncbi:putative diguanylate cyclase YdaM [mine drainage metagenome]|uniref:Putative diguanylate cyclase YdaM n=1 Tax=mine drainage metagenome TaxID=410659 RepID=A0A1J5RW75_9ZZZZ
MHKSPTIKAQLIAVISFLSLMLVFLGWLGVSNLNKTVHSIHAIYTERVLPLETLKVVSDMYAVNIVDTAHKTRNGNLNWAQSLSKITEAEQKIQQNWNAYRIAAHLDEEKRLITQAAPLMESANKSIAKLKAIVEQHDSKALAYYTSYELYPEIDPITQKISELVAIQLVVAKSEYESSNKIYQQSFCLSLVAISTSILLATFIGVIFYRSITHVINQAHEYFMRMASGNVHIDIEINGQHELSKILEAAQSMKNKLVNDVTQAHETANEFARIKVALDNVSTNVMITDNARNIIYVNQSATQTLKKALPPLAQQHTGIQFDKLVGCNIDQFHQIPSEQAKILATLNKTYRTQISIANKAFRLTANPVVNDTNNRLGIVVEWEDVTDRIALQQKLEDQAQRDFLTGLANRRYFIELAEQELLRTLRYKCDLSVLVLDLDYFKKINDAYGHKAGDLVLQQFARTCQVVLREVDIIGRLGGEEFAVLLPKAAGALAVEIAERLLKAFQDDSVTLDNNETIKFTASIGVATLSNESQSIDEMLQEADAALYRAKHAGRNKVVAAFWRV